MPDDASIETLASRAITLRRLHAGPAMLVLPNAWDAATAKALEAAGFPAIATTSGGVANALGYEDHEGAPLEEMLAADARITRAVSIPVTVDFEAGYGLEPREVVERLIAAGAAGFNFEDSDHATGSGLIDAEAQAGRIAALKDAGRSAGADLVLNARVDVFIQRQGSLDEQVDEGLRRARLYRDAGADCIYPILQADEAILARFIEAVGAINVNLRPGGQLTLQRAAAIGVRRISYATSLFRAAMGTVEQLAAQIHDEAAAL
jgi:2-methylisocitrate lyase-like PEP mutase family enzyme